MQIDESNKFLDAVKVGDLAVVSSLLAADPQLLNVRDESGVSVLMLVDTMEKRKSRHISCRGRTSWTYSKRLHWGMWSGLVS